MRCQHSYRFSHHVAWYCFCLVGQCANNNCPMYKLFLSQVTHILTTGPLLQDNIGLDAEILWTLELLKAWLLFSICVVLAFACRIDWVLFKFGVCMTFALSVHIAFRSVSVAIENANTSRMHPIPTMLKWLYGASRLATIKGGIGSAYRGVNTPHTYHIYMQ